MPQGSAPITAALFQSRLLATVAFLVTLVLAYATGGATGIAGAGLGLGATGFGVVFLWLAVQQVGKLAADHAKPYRGGVAVGLGFLIKLPLFVAAGMVAQNIGGTAPTWFLIGLGVVYSALVGWAMTRP